MYQIAHFMIWEVEWGGGLGTMEAVQDQGCRRAAGAGGTGDRRGGEQLT